MKREERPRTTYRKLVRKRVFPSARAAGANGSSRNLLDHRRLRGLPLFALADGYANALVAFPVTDLAFATAIPIRLASRAAHFGVRVADNASRGRELVWRLFDKDVSLLVLGDRCVAALVSLHEALAHLRDELHNERRVRLFRPGILSGNGELF